MSLGPDRAKSRGNKSMHISCSIDFGSATPLSPHTMAVFLTVRPSALSFPPSSIDLLLFCPPFSPLSSSSFRTSSHRQASSPGVVAPIRRRPLPWQRSFQFSPGSRLIALTSLRLPLSAALICYPAHFTPFHRSFPLFVSPLSLALPLPPSFSLIVGGFKRLSV